MPVNNPKINSRTLTKHLNLIGAEVHTIDDAGNPITKEQALADLLWKFALGYTEETRDDKGTVKTVVHKPLSWAIQYVWERKEGKAVTAAPEDEGRVRASDRVRELAKQRLNGLATAAAAGVKKGPPSYKGKR